MRYEILTQKVIGCAIEVHKALGPGLLESTYQSCLSRELSLNNIKHACQVPLPVEYKGIVLECGYRVDILVEDSLIIEIKSVEQIISVHSSQILTYMKLAHAKLGLLINFNVPILKDGIKRFIL